MTGGSIKNGSNGLQPTSAFCADARWPLGSAYVAYVRERVYDVGLMANRIEEMEGEEENAHGMGCFGVFFFLPPSGHQSTRRRRRFKLSRCLNDRVPPSGAR